MKPDGTGSFANDLAQRFARLKAQAWDAGSGGDMELEQREG